MYDLTHNAIYVYYKLITIASTTRIFHTNVSVRKVARSSKLRIGRYIRLQVPRNEIQCNGMVSDQCIFQIKTCFSTEHYKELVYKE